MVRTIIKITSILILLLYTLYFITDRSRRYYHLSNNKCITVWKRLGGDCYIIPYKYFGVFVPSEYIKTKNSNAITIIYDKQSEYDYVVFNDYGEDLEVNTTKFNIKYYSYGNRESFINRYYLNDHIKENLQYLQIDIGEELVVVNGKVM